MKWLFYGLWALIFVPAGAFSLYGGWGDPSVEGLLVTGLIGYLALGFFRLIRCGYPPRQELRTPRVGTTFWLGWILLPLSLPPLLRALEVLQAGAYRLEPHGKRRLLGLLLQQLDSGFGPWAPALCLLIASLAMLLFALGLMRADWRARQRTWR